MLLESQFAITMSWRISPRVCSPQVRFLTTEQRLVKLGSKWRHKTIQETPTLVQNKNNQTQKYILSMFPYPSGVLHLGHLRVYVISDSLSRFYRQKGFNVIHPMGWDAFGLPAENAAIDKKINPADWTLKNISAMKEQMKNMLANFDWSREVTTCKKEYYKFTQLLFLWLYRNNLAYYKESKINWDPIDKTVLANEQVDSTGHSWRSGAIVEKIFKKQWFLSITQFGNELQDDLEYLTNWPSKVKIMQKNWIFKSNGVTLDFELNDKIFSKLSVFTTRVETLFSVEYIALSMDHPIVQAIKKDDVNLEYFIKENNKFNSKDGEYETPKTGYKLDGLTAMVPLTNKKVPIFVAPYVISGYATDAVMGVPAHDERDFEFWKTNISKLNNKPQNLQPSLLPEDIVKQPLIDKPYLEKEGIMTQLAGKYSGQLASTARNNLTEELSKLQIGEKTTTFKMRDWLISRQRYWGTPIPIIHCEKCGTVPVPEEQLPIELPKVDELFAKGATLAQIPDFVHTTCPSCHSPAKRETDTMDTFIDSSWYFFRYLDPKNTSALFKKDVINKVMPVDIYIGGVEHAILHLLYSRFISKFLGKIGKWKDLRGHYEPFDKLVTQGMVHGKTYQDPNTKKYLKPEELIFTNNATSPVRVKSSNEIPIVTYTKMSKSKFNGVDPNKCIEEYGPDAVRAHILFQAPIADILEWDNAKIVGITRWLSKLLELVEKVSMVKAVSPSNASDLSLNDNETEMHNQIQQLLKSITNSFETRLSLNTVVSDYMKLTNIIQKGFENNQIRPSLLLLNIKKLISVIYPIIPSISEEATEIINKNQKSDWSQYAWPIVEEQIIIKRQNYKIMINGKMRGILEEDVSFTDQDATTIFQYLMGRKDLNFHEFLQSKSVKKAFIKNDIISFVLNK